MVVAPVLLTPERHLSLVEAEEGRRRRDWPRHARPEQLPPLGDWSIWLILTGRGWGKTRTGAEFIRAEVAAGRMVRVALVAPTAADARDVMIEGESGLLAVCGTDERPTYNPSLRRLTWPNGAIATTYSADEPDRLRGPQHDGAWSDEAAAWRYPETWDMLQFGLRLGGRPRQVVTTTPKPVTIVRGLVERTDAGRLVGRPGVHLTTGRTEENAANLAPAFLSSISTLYGGTRLGRQEVGGELLEDVEGAHWTGGLIEAGRVTTADVPPLRRIVVGIDPQGQTGIGSETGIIVAGVGRPVGADADHGYVLADGSGDFTPDGWARAAVNLYRMLRADRIVAETNFGGQMVASTIRTVDPSAAVEMVSASRGKLVRAEPVAALYEQGRVHHVGGYPQLEDEMTGYDGTGPSPNRMDALVWTITDLMVEPASGFVIPHIPPPIGFVGESTWAGGGGRSSWEPGSGGLSEWPGRGW